MITYKDIISFENLFRAWEEFVRGKRKRKDMIDFSVRLSNNTYTLHRELRDKKYRHGPYHEFYICDPKPRIIHKSSVRDRLVHHAIYRILYPFYDRTFIADSYSCRKNKGTHKALNRFRKFFWGVSQNNTRTCWVLKCDIEQFFASIDHTVLMNILRERISDEDILWLLAEIISSFSTRTGIGLPLGNLTSQLLVNVYMNEFDQFVKHELGAKHYIRYADDFVLFSHDRKWLEAQIPKITSFLKDRLYLSAHKVSIKTASSGIDFLGWVHFFDHRVLRATTKRRMFAKIKEHPVSETLASYSGLLRHGNTFKIRNELFKKWTP